jgi:hypothetical protein
VPVTPISGEAELEKKKVACSSTCDLRHVPEELWDLAQAAAGD